MGFFNQECDIFCNNRESRKLLFTISVLWLHRKIIFEYIVSLYFHQKKKSPRQIQFSNDEILKVPSKIGIYPANAKPMELFQKSENLLNFKLHANTKYIIC